MTVKTDLIDDIFDRVKNIIGADSNATVKIALESEKDKVRLERGGSSQYIFKSSKVDKKCIILSELRKGLTVKEISSSTGISRTLIYNYLKSKG